MRNEFRFRRAPRRTITKNKIDSGILEQLTAIRLGLAEDVRKNKELMALVLENGK